MQFHSDDRVMSEETCFAHDQMDNNMHMHIYRCSSVCSWQLLLHLSCDRGLLVTHEKENVSPTGLIYRTSYGTLCVCAWIQTEGASFVPSPAVCVLRGLMSKQEEVSDGQGTKLWDITTGELSVCLSVCLLVLCITCMSRQQFVITPWASCMDAHFTTASFLQRVYLVVASVASCRVQALIMSN